MMLINVAANSGHNGSFKCANAKEAVFYGNTIVTDKDYY